MGGDNIRCTCAHGLLMLRNMMGCMGWVGKDVNVPRTFNATQHDGVGGGVRKDVNVCRTCTHG